MHGAGPQHDAIAGDAAADADTTTAAARLARQLDFLVEVDRLKGVLRRTTLCDGSRPENSAEHSWHLALSALVLAEYAGPGVDVMRAVRMLLVHDLVEIDAGDTFAYDAAANEGRAERERQAARRVFGLLPDPQGAELHRLWEEFEAETTPDARFAAAVDRLQPLLANDRSGGGSWRAHGIARAQVVQRMAPIEAALPAVWPAVLDVVERNCALGHIRADGAA
jgi:putative hydrolase of HD superfamily